VIAMTDVRERLRRASEHVTPRDGAFERMLERRDRKQRHERVAAATVALVVAFAVIGGGLTLLSGLLREGVKPGSDGTEQVHPRLVLDPGEYFYLRITSSEEADGWIRDEETWWALDDSGEVRNRSTRQDKYPYPPTGVYDAGEFPAELFAGKDVSALSTDPERLAAQLQTESPYADVLMGEPEPERLWDVIRILLLDHPNVTPDLRAALFEVAAGLPGVRMTEQVQDPVGRSATTLSFTNEDERITWTGYFDPATRQLMAWTSVYEDNPPAWIVLDSAIVDAPGTGATADDWLFQQSSVTGEPAIDS
jgi:hypothetical protein